MQAPCVTSFGISASAQSFSSSIMAFPVLTHHRRNLAYSPTLQRWMQQDPAGYIEGHDLYMSVTDNPINREDPTGLAATSQPGTQPTTSPDQLSLAPVGFDTDTKRLQTLGSTAWAVMGKNNNPYGIMIPDIVQTSKSSLQGDMDTVWGAWGYLAEANFKLRVGEQYVVQQVKRTVKVTYNDGTTFTKAYALIERFDVAAYEKAGQVHDMHYLFLPLHAAGGIKSAASTTTIRYSVGNCSAKNDKYLEYWRKDTNKMEDAEGIFAEADDKWKQDVKETRPGTTQTINFTLQPPALTIK